MLFFGLMTQHLLFFFLKKNYNNDKFGASLKVMRKERGRDTEQYFVIMNLTAETNLMCPYCEKKTLTKKKKFPQCLKNQKRLVEVNNLRFSCTSHLPQNCK